MSTFRETSTLETPNRRMIAIFKKIRVIFLHECHLSRFPSHRCSMSATSSSAQPSSSHERHLPSIRVIRVIFHIIHVSLCHCLATSSSPTITETAATEPRYVGPTVRSRNRYVFKKFVRKRYLRLFQNVLRNFKKSTNYGKLLCRVRNPPFSPTR